MKYDGSSEAGRTKDYEVAEEDNFMMTIREGEVPVYRADNFAKIEHMQEGATKEDVDYFKLRAQLDYESLARLLHVTKATLFNRKGRRFDSQFSERLLILKDLYSYGYSVLGSDKFNLWMKTDNVGLQRRPLDLAASLYGISEIRTIIGRIDYGIYS